MAHKNYSKDERNKRYVKSYLPVVEKIEEELGVEYDGNWGDGEELKEFVDYYSRELIERADDKWDIVMAAYSFDYEG